MSSQRGYNPNPTPGFRIRFMPLHAARTDANPAARIAAFLEYVRLHITGYEKGEAHLYCDRLFQAFGHGGIREAGGSLEYRVHQGAGTKFADLLWRPRVLLEMKKRGEKLERHYRQAFEYWLHLVPNRPEYVVLCNFDEFWIYDLNQQLDEPMDRVLLTDLPERYTALNFLFPEKKRPLFNNDRVAVTRAAADKIAQVFNLLVADGHDRQRAQRFILQSVLCLFAQSISLLPRGLFTQILSDCQRGASSRKLLGGLFRQMDRRRRAKRGRFDGVPYFNGSLFAKVAALDLGGAELELMSAAAQENWAKVQPPIFGALFEGSMDKEDRHALGAHFTSEADIQKVVLPTIVRPWRQRIRSARTARELLSLRREMLEFRVLDPACGSGNFLYVAYRELKRLEVELLNKLYENFGPQTQKRSGGTSLVSAGQFYGIDISRFAVELAKVTLMLGKKLALDETQAALATGEAHLPFDMTEHALPLDNLDRNIRCDDALFCDWPDADAVIGNPPYQSKNKMQQEYGSDYVSKVRERFPDVPGRADYCVYWFRRAHEELKPGCRAGLVGTNTIRQNYSREGGLDYVVGHGGTITEAVSTQVWSGEAVVHVSIVNWLKGKSLDKKKLFVQKGDDIESPWEVHELSTINSSLSVGIDVSDAARLRTNIECGGCYQGQTHGHEGFLLTRDDAKRLVRDPRTRPVVHPYLIADELFGEIKGQPTRWAIDLNEADDLVAAKMFGDAFRHVEELVLPHVKAKAAKEFQETNDKTGPRQSHLKRWWRFWRGRPELIGKISTLPRYIACGQVTKRPIFEFIDRRISPNAALIVFPFADDYSFGVLQSGIHWQWFVVRCSTLKADFRYTSDTVFDTFAWPQKPTVKKVNAVAHAATELRAIRRRVMSQHNWSLRDLYRSLELPGKNPLREAHDDLDTTVRAAYGMPPKADALTFLLKLNQEVADREESMRPVVAPGLPPCVTDPEAFVTDDCVAPPRL